MLALIHIRNRLLILCPMAVVLLSARTWANDVKQEMTSAVSAVRPALIRIHVVSADYDQGREMRSESAGSGVIISPDGYAVTNHHVAADAERLVCTLADKREVDARLIGTDPLADIAVIKLTAEDGMQFPAAQFGDSSKLEVGDRVYAMGSPFAISQSVTMGIVSNTEMILPEMFSSEGLMLEGEDVGSIVRWIGHDALIEPGNSGGPLVDGGGRIVGINEISLGLAGAIPGNLAREVAQRLTKDGKVVRSWLGIEVQPLLKSSGIEKGILVSDVLPGTPAAKAGIVSGDILLSLQGHEVTARFKEEVPLFNQWVAALPVGETVAVKLLRDGTEMTVEVTTVERPKAKDREHELRSWGICATNITYLMQKEMELGSQAGVLVTSVLPSGPAGSCKPSIREGDVLTRVGEHAIKDVAQLRELTADITRDTEDPVAVVVGFQRDQKQYLTVVKVGKEEMSQPGAEIRKAWLPIDLQVLTRELAEALEVPDETGVRVTQTYKVDGKEPPLQVGDIVVKLDGDEIPAEQIGDEEVLPSLIRQYEIGATVKLGIIRDGKPIDVDVKLGTSPKPARDYPKFEEDNFEFTARDISFSDRSESPARAGESGAYIEGVSQGSWAALGGLRSGDVVTRVNGKPIGGLEELKKAMAQVAESKPDVVVFVVRRGIHTQYLEFRPEWPET